MASTVPAFSDNLNIIQALTDEPNDMDGLTAAELKAKFDEAGNRIKSYLNSRLRPFVNGINEALEDLEKEFLEGTDAGLAYENHMDNRTAIALLFNYARQLEWSLDNMETLDLMDLETAFSLLFNYTRQLEWSLDTMEQKHLTDLETAFAILLNHARQNAWATEQGEVTLSNSLRFPFNNSRQTVVMETERDRDYIVVTELVSATGNPGEIEVSDKLTNGFKLAYTGSASQAVIKFTVIGGELK